MVRRQERLIATLLVWIATLLALSAILERLLRPNLDMQNNWYYYAPVVTGENAEEASQAISRIQDISSSVYYQIQQFAHSELLQYSPAILFVSAAILLAAVLSTVFIWRSVIVLELHTGDDRAALGKIKASRLREMEAVDLDSEIDDFEPLSSRNGQ